MPRDPSTLFPHDYLLRATLIPCIPQAITPNHITLIRLIITPFVLLFLATDNLHLGIPLFLFAIFTDALDGALARCRRQITPWGILFDPIADKLLVGLVIIVFALRYYHPVLIFAAVAVDALPVCLWLVRGGRHRGMMMANMWGKTKMVLQCCSLTLLLFGIVLALPALIALGEYTLAAALVCGIVASLTYSL